MTELLDTVYLALARHAKKWPDKPALRCADQEVSYGELASRVEKLAGRLHGLGIKAGDFVGVDTSDPVVHLTGVIGVMRAGGVPVPLPSDPAGAQAVLADCKPKLAIDPKGLQEMIAGPPVDPAPLPAPRPDTPAIIYYTSGTSSGVRKGVVQSHRAQAATARYISEFMQLTADVREFVASPVDNAFWFGRCRVIIHVGGTLILNHGALNPLRILSDLRRFEGNSLSGDTPIFVLFLRYMENRLGNIGEQIRWAKIASQAMPVNDKKKLMEVLPKARIVMNYGLTEAMRCCMLSFRDNPEKLASVGRPSPTVSVTVRDSANNQVPPGTPGEILVQGDNLASGYLNNDDLWRTRFQNGWYATNDLGYVDADGFVYIQGRIDEAINVGGRTIAPSEVEQNIRSYLTNSNFVVSSIADPAGVLGDIIVLCIEGEWREAEPWKQLRVRMFEKVPAHFVPKEATLVKTIPVTGNGKVQRGILRNLLQTSPFQPL